VSRRLKAEELRATCDPATLPFRSTAALEPLHGLIGQERALEATTFGIGMRPGGYNLFVLGAPVPRARSVAARARPRRWRDWNRPHAPLASA
jgi:hypothetical protein